MNELVAWLLWVLGAYLVGSVPFALLLGWLRGVDIRRHGSGNVGATNAGRVLGRRWGVLCFVLDVTKGAGPVLGYGLAAGLIGAAAAGVGEADTAAAALRWVAVGAAAVVGHVFPLWLGFRGGKGVATGLGVLLGLWPVLTAPGVAAALVWLGVLRASGYVSLASMAAALVLPVLTVIAGLAFALPGGQIAVYGLVTAVLALLVVARHRTNIARLRDGTEAKVTWASKRHAQ